MAQVKTKTNNVTTNETETLASSISTEAERVPFENTQNNMYLKLQEQIEEQNKRIEELTRILQKTQSESINLSSHKDDMVKIVHLVQRGEKMKTIIQLSNLLITMHNLGEERNLTLQQFEELVGKKRRWFELGIIAVAAGYEDVAARYGVAVIKDYPLTQEFLNSLTTISMETLESVFSKLPEAGKDSIIGYWTRKVVEGNAKFKDVRKLEVLNRLSDGGLTQLINNINSGNKK